MIKQLLFIVIVSTIFMGAQERPTGGQHKLGPKPTIKKKEISSPQHAHIRVQEIIDEFHATAQRIQTSEKLAELLSDKAEEIEALNLSKAEKDAALEEIQGTFKSLFHLRRQALKTEFSGIPSVERKPIIDRQQQRNLDHIVQAFNQDTAKNLKPRQIESKLGQAIQNIKALDVPEQVKLSTIEMLRKTAQSLLERPYYIPAQPRPTKKNTP